MGAWGEGPFDNDSAADWSLTVDDADDPVALTLETFRAVTQTGYVDSPEATEAVAAAAWLASALPGAPTLPEGYAPKIEPPALTDELRDEAVRALQRVLSEDSEWLELWREVEATDAVEGVRDVIEILTR